MKHHDRIDALANRMQKMIELEADQIVAAAISDAVDRDLAEAADAGLMFAHASEDRKGSIAIVFNDRDGQLSGSCGWPDERRDPTLTLDPLWIAKDIRTGIEEDGYDCQPGKRESIEALERSLRSAADLLREILEKVDAAQ